MIEKLQEKQNNAVSVVRRTISDLVVINDEIDQEIDKNKSIIEAVSDINCDLQAIRGDNSNLIKNFKKLLEV